MEATEGVPLITPVAVLPVKPVGRVANVKELGFAPLMTGERVKLVPTVNL